MRRRPGICPYFPEGAGSFLLASCWAKEEVVAKVADATKVIDGEGEELGVLGVEGGNDINTGHGIATATNLHLYLLIVLVMSAWDT